ncbi:hypothetical protein KOR34_27250 [Posidoniimonas corsicana]|uniref:DUF3754 domain-containing protein n=2 Tax=Posidoniimonas corsicana TaxID=1938618 RepID=A0A5C5VJ79_9BACT|nr:hypothetical protein KOR34_27250 [Posidoniimonas corsicana]
MMPMHQTLETAADRSIEKECWRPERRFVPLRAEDLADLLVQDAAAFGVDCASLRGVFDEVRAVIEQEGSYFHSELELAYARFNPDRETLRVTDDEPSEQSAYDALHRQLSYLLDKANFERLDDVRIAEVVERASTARIHVRIHPDRVERLELWVRGHGHTSCRRRTIRCPIRGAEFKTPVFKRLAVIAQLKDEPDVLIKMFKDIPEHDVEALLPHAEAAMTLLDRIKLLGSGAGVAGAMAMKLAKVALAFAMLSKILWILAVGVGTIALRTFFGYKNAKTSRDWRRTQRLYFQNLGNNASALQLLISSVKQEELKEAYLAYAFTLDPARRDEPEERLNQRIAAYLYKKLGVEVDFDLPDALETLGRLDLWRREGELLARPPLDARQRLEDHRREQRSSDYHARAIKIYVGEPGAAPRPSVEPPRRAIELSPGQRGKKLS